jgi:hypothetical protein
MQTSVLVNGATATDCTHQRQSTPAESVTRPGLYRLRVCGTKRAGMENVFAESDLKNALLVSRSRKRQELMLNRLISLGHRLHF